MVKLIALFRQPDDPEAFMTHYREVHTPLARKIPGLQRLVVDTVTADGFGGEPAYTLIAEMHFENRETFRAAMRSPENRALTDDLKSFAAGIATVLVTDSEEVR